MAALEVLALDTATPRIRAPGVGDTYTMPRALAVTGNITGSNLSGTNTGDGPTLGALMQITIANYTV